MTATPGVKVPMMQRMIRNIGLAVLTTACVAAGFAQSTVYQNDFQSAAVGKAPEDMLVLAEGFAVRAEGDAKFLELPGAPLETFGVLFGPAVTNNVEVSARVHGTRRGRLFPAFGVGLGGVNGYKLRVSPGKKLIELLKADTELATAPFDWASGEWAHLRLRLRETSPGAWQVEGKVWTATGPEPNTWQLTYDENTPPRAGRAAIWGAPYAGTPIRYDDLRLERVGESAEMLKR